MKRIGWFCSLLVLCACTRGLPVEDVPLNPIFHDNSSKVWLIDKILGGDIEIQNIEMADKSVITFFKNESCEIEEIGSFGRGMSKEGMFSIRDKELIVYTDHETWKFSIEPLEENRILLKPLSDSDYKYAMEIIPYPGN